MGLSSRTVVAMVAFAAVACAPVHMTTTRMTLLSGQKIVVLGDSVTGGPDYPNRFLVYESNAQVGDPLVKEIRQVWDG